MSGASVYGGMRGGGGWGGIVGSGDGALWGECDGYSCCVMPRWVWVLGGELGLGRRMANGVARDG